MHLHEEHQLPQTKKMLVAHDERFNFYQKRGKGSHRVIEHPDIEDQRVANIIPVHGEGGDILKQYLAQTKRKFNLPQDFFD